MSSWQNPGYRHLSLGWDRGWCQAFLDPLVRARIGWERISLLKTWSQSGKTAENHRHSSENLVVSVKDSWFAISPCELHPVL